jgi:hypothetical protein
MTDHLETGEYYTLKDLFTADRKIIIPDLQRDYCWGNKSHGRNKDIELVTNFLTNLIEAFKKKESLTLGLIYAYEHPINHIQLCDGQQRITTLYLLLGMLNRKTDGLFKETLISEYELKQDDKEPYLQYAVRESTLYFLADLVNEFFLQNSTAIEDIKEQDWYFLEYDIDPSIQSMLNALSLIDYQINALEQYAEFGEYICTQLKFLYYDMGDRHHGEETFVVINTTGEPLTATENLKPILLTDPEISIGKRAQLSTEWEERETFFWKNRNQENDKKKQELTADNSLNQFLIWYWQIKLRQESDWTSGKARDLNPLALFSKHPQSGSRNSNTENYELSEAEWESHKSLEEVQRYFKAYEFLVKNLLLDANSKEVLHTIQQASKIFNNASYFRQLPSNVLLPLLEYCVKYEVTSISNHLYHFLRKLRKNYYSSIWPERRSKYVDWRHILQIIEFCDDPNSVLTFNHTTLDRFKNIPNIPNQVKEWYNAEEQLKDQLRHQNNTIPIDAWEDHPHLMGDLNPLFKVYKQLYPEFLIEQDILAQLYQTYVILHTKDFQRENNQLFNNFFLLNIPNSYKNCGFNAAHSWYCGIERMSSRWLHYKEWFYPIWIQLFENFEAQNTWGDILESYNRKIFTTAVTNGKLTHDLILKGVQIDTQLSIADYRTFVEERTKNWSWWDNVSATVFTLLYWELQYSDELFKTPSVKQIGIRPFYDEIMEGRFTLGNIKWAFHGPGNSRTENPFRLHNEIKQLHLEATELTKAERIAEANKLLDAVLLKNQSFTVSTEPAEMVE